MGTGNATPPVVESGPIDYLVVEFPNSRLTGEALPLLLDLVDRGIIRLLDLVLARKDPDGSVRGIAIADLDGDHRLDFAVFEGAASGLLDQADIDEAGTALAPGHMAGILIYENVWAAPFAAALRRAGGELVASGRIPATEVVDALQRAESNGSNRADKPRTRGRRTKEM